jgi:predicted outer membrane repeat protein
LTIEPGVEVIVTGPYEIDVLSSITAIGTEEDPIVFSSADVSSTWQGNRFQDAPPGSILAHCIIERANDSAVTLTNSSAIEIRNCMFRNNSAPLRGGAINAAGVLGVLRIEHSRFIDNVTNPSQSLVSSMGGAVWVGGSTVEISNSHFLRNKSVSLCGPNCPFACTAAARGGALYVQDGNVSVSNSEFLENRTDARVTFCCFTTDGNSITEGSAIFVADGVVRITNTTSSCNVGVPASCQRFAAGTGLFVGGGDVTVENSVISRNQDATGVAASGGTLMVTNSILFFNNGGSSQISGSPTITYSSVQGGYIGEGNIIFNPAFVGPGCSADDLRVLPGPAIDAGNPDPMFDDVCFPPSEGTLRNDMGAFGGPGACGWTEQ